MYAVFLLGVGVYQDVIEVANRRNIEEIPEYFIDESLEGRRRIGESKRHYLPFKGSIACSEGSFGFVFLRYSD